MLDKIPGIETAEYEVVEVAHNVEALTELFRGAKVVSNMVGPFMKYAPVVVEAALAAGCHYTDTTGEQDWMLMAQERWGAEFAAKGLLLSPGIAQMYTTGEIAANICLETPGLDTLDILVLWKGFPTYASTQTIFTILKAKWYYLAAEKVSSNGTSPPISRSPFPASMRRAIAVPWGGTAHPVWFKNDPRVANCKVDRRRAVARGDAGRRRDAADGQGEDQAAAAGSAGGGAGGHRRFAPGRACRRAKIRASTPRSISVHASGPLGRAHCVIHGNCNYKQTGMLQAYAAFSLLQTPPKRVGFASACQAFGHRELLGQLRSFGLVMNPILTVHA